MAANRVSDDDETSNPVVFLDIAIGGTLKGQ
jgi:hypothetical protein